MTTSATAKTAATTSTNVLTAMLLRSIATELAQRIIPELKSADAIERASLSRMILLNLAADIDLLPQLAAEALPAMQRAVAAATATAVDAPATGADTTLQFDLAALRDLAGAAVRRLADDGTTAAYEKLAPMGRWDARWVLDYDSAASARIASGAAPAAAGNATAPAGPVETVTVENVTRYLQRKFPDVPGIAAAEVIPIPGGRSKKTFFVNLKAAMAQLPRELVVRQDYALKYEGTKVADEYQPLVTLAKLGLPVPNPLHLEREPSELGAPFIFVNRLTGKPPGTYFSQGVDCPGAFRELARQLAKLHTTAPDTLGLKLPPAGTDNIRTVLATYRKKWRDNSIRSAPVFDYAYAWAERECAKDPGTTSVVHGDAGPYNLLVENDQLKAILDWEFVHVGDPAEDLGVARIYAEGCMPWDEFMRIYRDAGGQPVSEQRIRIGMLVQFLKGTTLVAASGRNFKEGGTSEFIKGATAFTGQRLIELRVAQLLERFGAV